MQGANEVAVSKVAPDAGYGLIAMVAYQPGDSITWYQGHMRVGPSSKLTKAEKAYALQWVKGASSLIGLRREQLTRGCGLASLANDRSLTKGPGPKQKNVNNAHFSRPVDKENNCCWLIADRLIKPGEEVTVKYGPGYKL